MVFFDSTTVQDVQNKFAPIPDGAYAVIVDKTEFKKNASNDGKHVSVVFKIVDGKYAKRLIFANYNISNPSKVAENIGRAEFKKFMVAIGLPPVLTTEDDFHQKAVNKTTTIFLEGYQDKNGKDRHEIKFGAPKISGPIILPRDDTDAGDIPF